MRGTQVELAVLPARHSVTRSFPVSQTVSQVTNTTQHTCELLRLQESLTSSSGGDWGVVGGLQREGPGRLSTTSVATSVGPSQENFNSVDEITVAGTVRLPPLPRWAQVVKRS